MKHQVFLKAVLCCALVVLVISSAQVSAQASAQSSRSRRGGFYGDWLVKMSFGERQFESILSFSRDREGNRTGQWISFWGLSELKDVKFEENKLSFVQVRQNREGQSTTTKFTGTIEEGILSGTLSSDRGESKLEGKRSPRTPRPVGSWAMKYKVGEREITGTLVIKADKERNLSAEWQSRRGESQITALKYERGTLTFKRTSKYGDREFESTFEGTVRGDTIAGAFKSERGELTAEGKLIGTPLIGSWILEIASEERGPRKQRLMVNPDMSGLYGSLPVKKVNLEDGKVSFKMVIEFGERKFEMSFEGKVEEAKLAGELKTSRGSQKVTGKKVVRTFRRRRTQ
ncbi:MAG TPA: hypothetical protein HPP66_01340 [Planctomycetes bacterium]|nr:hypothetical protein [Planctomycetota bacterium]